MPETIRTGKLARTPARSADVPSGGVRSPTPVVVIEAKPSWKLFDWREILAYRDLFYFLVLRDVTVVYKQTVLGIAWAVLTPFFSMVVFTVIFGKLLKVSSDGLPYPIFSYAGLVAWTYFAQSLTASTNSLIQGASIFTKVYFPRVFIPLVPVFSKLMDFAIALLLLVVMMIWYSLGSSMFSVGDLAELPSFASRLKEAPRAVDRYLAEQMSSETKAALLNYQGAGSNSSVPLQKALVLDLNRSVLGPLIYEAQRFLGVDLRPETKQLLSQYSQGKDPQRLNRLLLEDAYPLELSKNHKVLPTWNVFFLPLLVLMMMFTSAGIGMLLSALAIQYRDIRHAISFLVQILMYAAPVVWPASKLPPGARLWYGLYPMGGVIEGFRAALLGKTPMPWDLLGMGCITATIIFICGALYFRRTERIFADVA